MTLPNKLTLVRIALIPVMVVIAFIPALNQNYMFAGAMSIANFINVIIFIVASLTDFLDGYIARKYNLVTTFGKFADPLADKLLVISAMVILCLQINTYAPSLSWILPGWVIIVILCREFIVSGIRLVAVERGKVIPAGILGKIKTFTTMVALIILFFYQIAPLFYWVGGILMYVATLATVVSGFDYFYKNREIILESI